MYATNILHVQCACNTAHVYLSKLAAPARAVGCCLFSSRDAGSVRINYSPLVDDVVRLQVVAITLWQVTASAEGVGNINCRPSYPTSDCVTCKRYTTVSRRVTGSNVRC